MKPSYAIISFALFTVVSYILIRDGKYTMAAINVIVQVAFVYWDINNYRKLNSK